MLHHPTMNRRAFTLIELLVVIAIIAILAAILFPVFGRARENARRSSCQSNLKQIGLGVLQYVQDFDEKYPTSNNMAGAAANYATNGNNNWIAATQPYIKSWQVFLCPSVSAGAGLPAPNLNSATNYLYNGVTLGRSIASIQSSSTLVMTHELGVSASDAYIRPQSDPNAVVAPHNGNYKGWMETGPFRYDNNHFDGTNLLFCDGHVKYRKQNSISGRDFGLGGPNADIKGEVPGATLAPLDPAQVS